MLKKKDAEKAGGKAKKPAAVQPKAARKTKAAKNSKSKTVATGQSRFSEGGIKAVLAEHIEKVALAVLALAGVFIVYTAWSRDGIESSQSPDQLKAAISRAENHMRDSQFTTVAAERYPESDDFAAQASSDVAEVVVDQYAVDQHWEPLKFALRTKRSDPPLETVRQIEVTYGSGPLATMPKNRPATGLAAGAAAAGYADGYGNEILDDPNIRELPEDWVAHIRTSFPPPPDAELKPVRFVAVTGLIPLKEQFSIYKDAFMNADGFLPERDYPKYMINFEVQRAEVAADGSLSEWKTIWGAVKEEERSSEEKNARKLIGQWTGLMVEEMANRRNFDPATAMPLPPLINRDLERYATHPEIGLQPPVEAMYNEQYDQQVEDANPWASGGPPVPGAEMGGAGGYGEGGYGGGYGASSSDGGYGGGYGGGPPSGYGSGYGGGPPSGYGSGYGGGPPSGYGSGYGGGPPSGYGSGYGGGYGGAGGYGGGEGGAMAAYDEDGVPLNLPEYKLFRFFDFTVQPDKTYRYRVRLALEDPNNPYDPRTRPRVPNLDQSVIARLKQLPVPEKPEDRVYWRMTDWSEPSEPLHVGSDDRVIAGATTAPSMKSVKVNDRTVYYENPSQEPEAELIVVEFDRQQAGDIPGELTRVRRGAVANFRENDAELIDPLKMQLKKVDKHTFKSDYMVVDILGGQRLPSARGAKDKLTVPGEVLFMSPTGELVTHQELEDAEEYFFNKLPPPEPTDRGAYGEEGDGYYGSGGRGSRARGRRGGYGEGSGGDGYEDGGRSRRSRRSRRGGYGY
jgi:hypothetical protein